MTADWVRIDYEVLSRISSRIMNEVSGISRVTYDISSKPPATTFEQQVSSADILLLNKIDRVPQDALSEIETALDHMAPGTPIIRTEKSQVSTSVLFPPDPEGVRSQRATSQPNWTPHHHEAFEAKYLTVESGKDVGEIQQFLLDQQAIRIKGFVDTTEGLRLVQGIGPRVDLVPPSYPPPEHLIGQVVLICRSNQPHLSHE